MPKKGMTKEEKLERSKLVKLATDRVRKLTEGSEWDIRQQIVQDIESQFIVDDKHQYSNAKLRELLIQEIKLRYKHDTDMMELLLEATPSDVSIGKWRQHKNWEDALWSKIKNSGLFTPERKARVINALYQKAIEKKDVAAAKVWLTMSGDYSERGDATRGDAVMDMFREINEKLHKSKSNG